MKILTDGVLSECPFPELSSYSNHIWWKAERHNKFSKMLEDFWLWIIFCFSLKFICIRFSLTSSSHLYDFPGGTSGKNPTANVRDIRDAGSIPGSERSPEGGHGNPLQYSCLENPMDRGSWWAIVHRVAKSWTWLKWLSTYG